LPLGTILVANSGAGTNATVNYGAGLPIFVSNSGKCIVGSNTTITVQTGAPPAQNLWTTLCSVTFPAMPIDPGFGNAEFRLVPGNIDLTFGANIPSEIQFELNVTSNCAAGAQSEQDIHGYGSTYLTSFVPNQTYLHLQWPAPMVAQWEGSTTSDNPISCGATASLKAVALGGSNVIALTNGTGTSTKPVDGTQAEIQEVPIMGVAN
jgi:hypothetical protein